MRLRWPIPRDAFVAADIDAGGKTDGSGLFVVGMGAKDKSVSRTDLDSHLKKRELRIVKVSEKSGEMCARRGERICAAGEGREGICVFDSGGGLVRFERGKVLLVGVTSGATGVDRCGESGRVGFYTRVRMYEKGIKEAMRGDAPKGWSRVE